MKYLAVFSPVIAICIGLYFINPVDNYLSWIIPKCPFKLLTGFNCPGCGIQRFLHALLHGRPLDAIHYNYFLIYSLPYLFFLGIAKALPKSKIKVHMTEFFEGSVMVWIYVISYFIWMIVRNILGI